MIKITQKLSSKTKTLFLVMCFSLFLFASNTGAFGQPVDGWERPGECNTGPINESILVPSGDIKVDVDGTIIENVFVTGMINIYANNVTIRNFKIDANSNYWAIRAHNGVTGLTIEDGEIFNMKSEVTYPASDYVARRLEVHTSQGDAFKMNTNATVESCWMHHLGLGVDAHADGFQLTQGSNVIIRGNYIEGYPLSGDYKFNAVLIAKTDQGVIDNLLFENNWADGGNYQLYVRDGGNGYGCPTNVTIRNNHFGGHWNHGFSSYDCPTNITYENNLEDPEDTSTIPGCQNANAVAVSGVTISETSISLAGAETQDLTVTVSPANATSTSVSWSSGNAAVATVSTTGLVTALTAGSATITATTTDGGYTATCEVTVTSSGTGDGIVVTGDRVETITGSTSDQLLYSDGTVKWIGDVAIRVGGSAAMDGVAVYPFALPALNTGEAIVSASFSANLKVIAQAPEGNIDLYGIAYRAASSVAATDYWQGAYSTDPGNTAIQDDFATLTTPVGDVISNATASANLAAFINAQYAAGAQAGDYVFFRLTPDVAEVSNYWYWEFYTADATDKPILKLGISDAAATNTEVTGVSVTPTSLALVQGATSGLTEIIAPVNATNKSVTWASGNTAIATVSAAGLVTAVAVGTATITVTTTDGGHTATCELTVTEASATTAVTGVSVTPTSLALVQGATSGLTETIEPTNATNKSVTWASGNAAVATVSATGLVTALTAGSATITVTTTDGMHTATCEVTVTEAGTGTADRTETIYADVNDQQMNDDGTSIWINQTALRVGGVAAINGVLVFPFALPALTAEEAVVSAKLSVNLKGITNTPEGNVDIYALSYRAANTVLTTDYWQGAFGTDVSNTAIQDDFATLTTAVGTIASDATASVNLTAFINAQYAVGAKAGDFVFVRLTPDVAGVTNYSYWEFYTADSADKPTLELGIGGPASTAEVTGVSLNSAAVSVNQGATSGLTETIEPANAADKSVTWASSNTAIATVSTTGLVTGVAVGTATITVTTTDGAYTATCEVTVTQASASTAVTSVAVSTASLSLEQSETADLTETISPSDATDKSVAWSSSNIAVAIVNANGLVTALTVGSTTITVTTTDGGHTATCEVTVNASSSADQLMNLAPPTTDKFVIPDIVWPANVGDADVCLWNDDKIAVTTITIDDNIEYEHDWWLAKQELYDLKFTWNVIIGSVTDWSKYQTLVDKGNEIQAHDLATSVAHCDINSSTDSDYRTAMALVQTTINENLTNNRCLTFAYPCGTNKSELIKDSYIGVRGVTGTMNKANRINYMDVNSRSGLNDVHDIQILLDANELLWNHSYYRGWLSYHYHGLNNDTKKTETDAFLANLSANSKDIWIGGFAEVAQYGQERDTHTLTVNEINETDIKFTLTDQMNDMYFYFPLTVKVRINNSWANVYASQGGVVTQAVIVENGGNKYALVKAIPDMGQVTLSKTDDVNVVAISITPATLNIEEGQSFSLSEAVSPSNAVDQSVTWASSNTSVVTVDENGSVTAVATGTATVTVTTTDGGHTATCEVTVGAVDIAVTGVSIHTASLNLTPGQSSGLTETIEPANATDKSVAWASSNTAVATVDANGLVTAIEEGTATITVTTTNGGHTADCAITVSTATGWVRPGECNTGPTNEAILVASGTIDVYTEGAIIENVSVTGMINIYANNVTIRNFKIDADENYWAIRAYNDVKNLLIEDGEIFNMKSEILYPVNDYTARRLEVHTSQGDAFKVGTNATVESCWMHHLGLGVDAHADGFQLTKGNNVVIRGNYIEGYPLSGDYKFNAVLIAKTDQGLINNLLFENNWADGGNYQLYIRDGGSGCPTNVTIRNNHFGGHWVHGFSSYDCPANITFENNIEDAEGASSIPECGAVHAAGSANIAVLGVSISQTSLALAVEATHNLAQTVSPDDATDKSVTWASSNTAVATVDANGVVTAIAEGTATITVTTTDGSFSATCEVTVSDSVSVINSQAQIKQVGLYPNPNNGSFEVKLSGYNTGNKLTLSIFDMVGREVSAAKNIQINNDGSQSIFLNNLKTGIYIVTVTDGISLQQQRLIVR